MKKLLLLATVLGFISYTAMAQDEEKNLPKEKAKKETQEIIIRKNGDKNTRINVEINGDNVTINGKPLSEFKDDNVTINKRNITVWNPKEMNGFAITPGEFGDGMTFWKDNGKEQSYTFLGVTTEEVEGGARINDITKESAAEKAGLKKDDIITKIGDKKIENPDDLSETVRSYKPKDEVTVYYKRDGKENSVKAILGERKETTPFAFSYSAPNGLSRSFTMPRMPELATTIPNMRNFDGFAPLQKLEMYNDMFPRNQKLGLKIQDTEDGTGVKVLDVDKDSPAEKAGLKKDDILTEVAGKKVVNTDEAREELQQNKDKTAYTIKAKRNGVEMSFDIKVPKKLKTANL